MPVCYTHDTPVGLCFQARSDAMSGNVKCADCGCLSLTNKKTYEVVSADYAFRQSCYLAVDGGGYEILDRTPICACDAPAFQAIRHSGAAAIIKTEHICPEFVKWQSALSPKDHIEMKLLAEVRRETQAWRTQDVQDREKQGKAKQTTRIIAIVAAGIAALGAASSFWATFYK
jgi:hypothetical protein